MSVASLKVLERAARDDDVVLSPMDRALERRHVTPGRVAAGLAALAVVGAAGYAYVEYGLTRTLAVAGERVTISTVARGTFREYIPIMGNVVPRTTVYLGAVEGGQVTAVLAEAGAVVAAGEPLVRLENTNLQLEVIGREAQLTEQLNNLSSTRLAFEQNRLQHRRELIQIDYRIDEIERDLARLTPMLETGGVTRSEIDDLEAELAFQRELRAAVGEAQRVDEALRESQVASLQDAIDAMTRNLELTRENLSNLVITAPIAGQLTALDANVGESKAPGERIGQIDEQDAFSVSALIDEFYLPRISVGQTATAEIDGVRHRLEVVKVYPDVRNRQFEIELVFGGGTPGLIRRGQTLRMQLEIGQPAETLVLANGAFYDDTGGNWVFVLDERGDVAVRRAVTFGRRNPQRVEVLEGLRDGARVITSSYESFRDFDRVRLRDETS